MPDTFNNLMSSTDVLDLGSWTQKQLAQYVNEIFRQPTQKLHFLQGSINIKPISIGAKKIYSILTSRGGQAGVVSTGSTETFLTITRVNEVEAPTVMVTTTSQREIQQLLMARQELANQAAGINFDEEAEDNMNMATNVSEAIHKLWAFGNADLGLYGTINNPNINPVVGTAIYAETDPQAMLTWLMGHIKTVWRNSKIVERPNTVALPPNLQEKFASAFFANTGDNVLARARNVVADLEPGWYLMFKPWTELESATLEKFGVQSIGTNKDRMVIYSMSGNTVSESGVSPRYDGFFGGVSDVLIVPPTQNNLMMEKTIAVCASSVQNQYPGSAAYVTFNVP